MPLYQFHTRSHRNKLKALITTFGMLKANLLQDLFDRQPIPLQAVLLQPPC